MADNTEVNPQITDAVTQTNVKVVAEAPVEGAPEPVAEPKRKRA